MKHPGQLNHALGRPGSGRVAVRVRQKSASTVLSGPRPKKSDGKDIVPDHPGIISTFFFGTMTHSQQPWQIPEFSCLGCWKHWHGYVPPLELNHTPAILFFLCFFFFFAPCVNSPNSSGCFSDTIFVVIISSYILATQSEFPFPSLVTNRAKKKKKAPPTEAKSKES